MVKTFKTADLSVHTAAGLLAEMNYGVEYYPNSPFGSDGGVIVTDTNPEDLLYPEGWYFAKGLFRNKRNATLELPFVRRNAKYW